MTRTYVKLEPGDATRYIVGLHRLEEEEAEVFPGTRAGEYVYTFGPGSGPLATFVFSEDQPADFGYYIAKMLHRHLRVEHEMWTLAAGYLVLAHLLGWTLDRRSAPHLKRLDEVSRKFEEAGVWREQLKPLGVLVVLM